MQLNRTHRGLVFAVAVCALVLIPMSAIAQTWVPKDAVGKVLKVTPDSFYSYDDMSKHFDISFVENGWVNDQPMPAEDPTKPYIEKKFNATITLTPLGDSLATKVMPQIASGTGPDVLGLGTRVLALKFVDQGMLSGDHKQYLQYVPALTQQYDDKGYDLLQATKDGVLIAIPKHQSAPEYYYIQVRQDWLDKLGLKQPKTDTELMAVAEAFTTKDPDGNGKADTWGFSTYSLDDMANHWGGLDAFQSMYGNPGWYVDGGKLTNPTLSGSRKKFLTFFRSAVQKGAMDPDYLNNVQWNTKKLNAGRVGISAYHTDITGEAEGALGLEGKMTGTWRMLETPLKGDGGASGGMRRSNTDNVSMWFAFTAQGAKDQAKVKRFLHILDWWQYPNQGMHTMWFAYGIDPRITEVKAADYLYVGGNDNQAQRSAKPGWGVCYSWGNPGAFYPNVIWGGAPTPSATPLFALQQQKLVGGMPRYAGNLYFLCDIPPELDTKVKDFVRKNEVAFITGTRSLDTWDAYVKEWKANGGQEMFDLMTKQLTKLGIIK